MSFINYQTSFRILLSCTLILGTTLVYADGATIAKEKCERCHGPQGNSTFEDVPSIAGISHDYTLSAIKKFKNKKRKGAPFKTDGEPETDMNEVSKDLSPQEIKSLAKYYSQQTFIPHKQAFDPALAKKGKKVYKRRCKRCHDDGGRSVSEDAGRLAGQWTPYLEREMEMFMSGERKPRKKMARQLKKLNPGDIPALLNFFASQQD